MLWALIQQEYKLKLKSDKKTLLESLIVQVINNSSSGGQDGGDRAMITTSKEIYKMLQEMNDSGQSSGGVNFYP